MQPQNSTKHVSLGSNEWIKYLQNETIDKVYVHVCFIAGYNNLEVAEYLLQHGAEVNSQDKGGLIPLHNAASYGVSTAPAHTVHTVSILKKGNSSE